MAEGVGFEPTDGLPRLLISSQVPLTTHPPFHLIINGLSRLFYRRLTNTTILKTLKAFYGHSWAHIEIYARIKKYRYAGVIQARKRELLGTHCRRRVTEVQKLSHRQQG